MYVCTIYDTPAHAQIIIVDADLALRRGDVQAALNLLRKVEKASPHYTKARVVAANIHLTHRHDKKVYIRYFEELKDENKDSIAACCMLAEAHMRLQVCVNAHIHESCLSPMPYMSHISHIWHA